MMVYRPTSSAANRPDSARTDGTISRAALALPPATLLHRRCGRRGQAHHVRPRTSAGVPAQGAALPGRLRDDACPVALRLRPAADRHGDRMQPRRRRLSARDVERYVLDAIADPAYQTELGAYNIEFNVPPRPLPGHTGLDLEAEVRSQPQRRRDQGQLGRRPHRDDRHPAHADARASARRLDERVGPICGPQRLDLQRPRRGHPDRHLRPGAAELAGGVHRARIRLHQHAIALASGSGRLRRQLERGAGDGRPAAGAGRQLALLLRPPAVVGNPYRSCSRSPPTPGPRS